MSDIDALSNFIKALVRPFLIIYFAAIVGMMWFNQTEIPPLLAGIVSAITLEYFGERAFKRIKEVKGNSQEKEKV